LESSCILRLIKVEFFSHKLVYWQLLLLEILPPTSIQKFPIAIPSKLAFLRFLNGFAVESLQMNLFKIKALD